jgi:hypothetical protein
MLYSEAIWKTIEEGKSASDEPYGKNQASEGVGCSILRMAGRRSQTKNSCRGC